MDHQGLSLSVPEKLAVQKNQKKLRNRKFRKNQRNWNARKRLTQNL